MNWTLLADVANSGFFTALLGALTGAFAGAYAAQRVAERSKWRDTLLAEIRQTNAGMSIAFTIFNAAISIKKQHVNRLMAAFIEERARADEDLRRKLSGEIPQETPFFFKADFLSLPQADLPGDILSQHVFERLSVIGRPLSLVVTISQIAKSLDEAIIKRNMQIENFKSIPENSQGDLAFRYFGFTNSSGHTDSEYSDTLYAIHRYTDDLIFFSKLLCQDLRRHGLDLADIYKRQVDDAVPKVNEVKFEDERIRSLMPDETEYQDWLTSFPRQYENK